MTYQELLAKLGACDLARKEAGDRDMETVLRTCERADWLLWLYRHMAGKPGWPTHKQIVLAACDCAATAVKCARPQDRAVCRKAIATARKWTRGKATLDEVRDAADAADAYDAPAAAAAAYAAYAADAAAYAAARARTKHLRAMVPLVHKHCPMPKNSVLDMDGGRDG